MKGVGEGIAYAGMALAAAWMEVSDKDATGLWFVLVCWAILSEWGKK